MDQNVPMGLFLVILAPCIAGILKKTELDTDLKENHSVKLVNAL